MSSARESRALTRTLMLLSPAPMQVHIYLHSLFTTVFLVILRYFSLVLYGILMFQAWTRLPLGIQFLVYYIRIAPGYHIHLVLKLCAVCIIVLLIVILSSLWNEYEGECGGELLQSMDMNVSRAEELVSRSDALLKEIDDDNSSLHDSLDKLSHSLHIQAGDLHKVRRT